MEQEKRMKRQKSNKKQELKRVKKWDDEEKFQKERKRREMFKENLGVKNSAPEGKRNDEVLPS